MPAAVRLASVLGAATARSAREDAAERAELHGSLRLRQGAGRTRMTLVTLDCTHVDIAMSVSASRGAVYSHAVLRLRDQWRKR